VSGSANVIEGSAVFGTGRGLMAKGDGILSCCSLFPEVFELRGAAGQDAPLFPRQDEFVVFVRPLNLDDGNRVEVVCVAIGARDLDGRPGFLGCGAAVRGRNSNVFAEAYNFIVGTMWQPQIDRLLSNGRFSRAGMVEDNWKEGKAPVLEGRKRTCFRGDELRPALVFQADLRGDEHDLVFESISVASGLHVDAPVTIGVVQSERPGVSRLSRSLLGQLKSSLKKADERRATEKMRAHRRRHDYDARCAALEDRVRELERRMGSLYIAVQQMSIAEHKRAWRLPALRWKIDPYALERWGEKLGIGLIVGLLVVLVAFMLALMVFPELDAWILSVFSPA
jgi:hypothetical protein